MTDPAHWTIPQGFRFAGVASGLRSETGRRDIGAIVCDQVCNAAGVFTLNRVAAAPVQISRQRIPSNHIRGIVCCSGNANACTGEQGNRDAMQMADTLGAALGHSGQDFLIASTGIIGRPLPMNIVVPGIQKAAQSLRSDVDALSDFAHSILTTDSRVKISSLEVPIAHQGVHLLGIAKGAAMIGPNMATMLGFIVTDAVVAPALLQEVLTRAVDRSFNCISVEGHMSTNDTVFLLANGNAGNAPITTHGMALQQFEHAVTHVCGQLAKAIAEDAEGATHLVEIVVEGARTEAEARQLAKTVAESALVKTALFGADPNWGRIVSAAGYSGVAFEERDLSLYLGEYLLYDHGKPVPFDAAVVSGYLKNNRQLLVRLNLTHGNAQCRFWTCDLTYDYVKLNAEYTT